MSDTASRNHSSPKICAVVPVYNNESTVGGVLRGIIDVGMTVIVVNDGSTDSTAREIAGIEGAEIVTHETNLGKGAALLSGFRKARELKFTHVVVMDADGQHSVDDLPAVVSKATENPSAMVIGVRRLREAGKPLISRILRAHSNFWVWAETGRRIRDTQSGFRAYPLEAVLNLNLKCERYDFEIESLVKTVWAGVPTEQVEVLASYSFGSKSHFRPVADFLLVAKLNALLFIQAMFLPPGLRSRMHLVEYANLRLGRRIKEIVRGAILQESAGPGLLAASIGVGVTFGILPIWGFQMILAAAAAHVFRLSKAVVLAASNISIPLFMPFIIYASLLTGRLVLRGEIIVSLDLGRLNAATACRYASEYFVGATVLALAGGAAAWGVAWSAWLFFARFRRAS